MRCVYVKGKKKKTKKDIFNSQIKKCTFSSFQINFFEANQNENEKEKEMLIILIVQIYV